MNLLSAALRCVVLASLLMACGGTEGDPDRTRDQLESETCEAICDPGYHCELVEVQCIRAPCPPQPECVEDVPGDPSDPTCDDVVCEGGQHCELQEVWCITAPCPPQPVCVD